MESERANAGNASAILGFSFFTFEGIVTPLAGFANNMFVSLGVIIAICCCCVAILGYIIRHNISR